MARERLINRRRQGDLGEASAIEWLTSKGALVWFPLGHSPDVDLIAQLDNRLLRIQVKTTTCRTTTPDGHDRWVVGIATNGNNQSWSGVTKRFDAERVDYLFTLTGDGRRWLIPAHHLEARNAVTLGGPKYSEFEIEPGVMLERLVYGDRYSRSTITPPGEYPSGQRMAAVNRPAMPSQVRILSPPSEPPDRPSYERQPGRSGRAVVWPKRRITIPLRAFEDAGLSIGEAVRFRCDGPGRIVLERIEAGSNTLAADDRSGANRPGGEPGAALS